MNLDKPEQMCYNIFNANHAMGHTNCVVEQNLLQYQRPCVGKPVTVRDWRLRSWQPAQGLFFAQNGDAKMKEETIYIYELVDPRTDEVRYIGKTNDLERRLKEHIRAARKAKGINLRLEAWIRQLIGRNLKPKIVILEDITEGDWEEAERRWIRFGRSHDFSLLNIKKGGNGSEGGLNGYWYGITGEDHPTYGIRKTGEDNPMWGRSQSEKTRKLIGERIKEAYSDKTRTPWYGKSLTDEHKKKISKAKTGKKMSEEFKAKLRKRFSGQLNPMYGNTHSPEARAKISICSKLYAAKKRGEMDLVLELQEEYFEIYGEYNEKYPKKGD